jgi:hypothetical protein
LQFLPAGEGFLTKDFAHTAIVPRYPESKVS